MTSRKTRSPLVRLKDVVKVFGTRGRQTNALRGVSFEVRRGELVLLMGPSGSGKTTLLTLMAGLQPPTSGDIWIFGRRLTDCAPGQLQRIRAAQIGFIFQNFHLLDALSVIDNVTLVMKFCGVPKKERKRRALSVLKELRIDHLAFDSPRILSQGEKQRVAVARALVNDAELIIADEPTASLESKQGQEIVQCLYDNVKIHNRCAVVASHDRRILRFADRVLTLEDGILQEAGTVLV
jgi:putative ABC transport system ATP-binding protein